MGGLKRGDMSIKARGCVNVGVRIVKKQRLDKDGGVVVGVGVSGVCRYSVTLLSAPS